MKSSFFKICILLLTCAVVIAQDLTVVHIEGEAYTLEISGDKNQYKKLGYGPLLAAEEIVLKNKAKVKLINGENLLCELKNEGTYPIKSLKFSSVEEKSLFQKFCNYFHSFFVNHSSAESKIYYQNNIYAISRGGNSLPSRDFPLEGRIPIDAGPLNFHWTHDCDSCIYAIKVFDLETREQVVNVQSKDNFVALEDPSEYFEPGRKYYWSAEIVGKEVEYEYSFFDVATYDDYHKQVEALEESLSKELKKLPITPKTIYMMIGLNELDLSNYAIFYSHKQVRENPENTSLKDMSERFWYDQLLRY